MVSWRTVTQPKSLGGLGVPYMRSSNIALLGKLSWGMMHSPHKLWVCLLSSLYLLDDDFLCATQRCGMPCARLRIRLLVVSHGI